MHAARGCLPLIQLMSAHRVEICRVLYRAYFTNTLYILPSAYIAICTPWLSHPHILHTPSTLKICIYAACVDEIRKHARITSFWHFLALKVKIMSHRTQNCLRVYLWFLFFNCILVVFVIVFQKPSFSRKLLFTLGAIVKSTPIPMRSIYVVSQRCWICVSLWANLAFEFPLFKMKCSYMPLHCNSELETCFTVRANHLFSVIAEMFARQQFRFQGEGFRTFCAWKITMASQMIFHLFFCFKSFCANFTWMNLNVPCTFLTQKDVTWLVSI